MPSIATIPETQPSVHTPRNNRALRLDQRGKAVPRPPSRGAAVTRRSSRRSSTRPQDVEAVEKVEPRISDEQQEMPAAPAVGGDRGDGEGSSAAVNLPISPVAGTIECTQMGGSMTEATTHLEVAPASPPPQSVDRTAKPAAGGLCLSYGESLDGRCTQGEEQADLHAAEERVDEAIDDGSDGVVLAADDGSDDVINVAMCRGKSPPDGDGPPAHSSQQGGTMDGSEPKMELTDGGGGYEEAFAESGENAVVVLAGVRDCAAEETATPATPWQLESKSIPCGGDGGAEAACRGKLAEEVRKGCQICRTVRVVNARKAHAAIGPCYG